MEFFAAPVMVAARHLEGLFSIARDVGEGLGGIEELLGDLRVCASPAPPASPAPLPTHPLCLLQWGWHGGGKKKTRQDEQCGHSA